MDFSFVITVCFYLYSWPPFSHLATPSYKGAGKCTHQHVCRHVPNTKSEVLPPTEGRKKGVEGPVVNLWHRQLLIFLEGQRGLKARRRNRLYPEEGRRKLQRLREQMRLHPKG